MSAISSVNEKITCSVIIPTYNQSFDKIVLTIASVINQKDISVQIVIADDGSKIVHYEAIEAWFCSIGFTNYVFTDSNQNCGTVKNILKGINISTGDYVKVIAPGDLLIGEKCLVQWIMAMQASGLRWSFCDTVYYSGHSSSIQSMSFPARPRSISPYNTFNAKQMRINYFVYGDIAVGASMLCERKLLHDYLLLIADKVIYAEDNVFRIMMFDGEVAYYHDNASVLYEYGLGVSTSGNSSWSSKVMKDSLVTDEIIAQRKKDSFQRKMLQTYTNISDRKRRKRRFPIGPNELIFNFDKLITNRRTPIVNVNENPFLMTCIRTVDEVCG